MSSKKKYMDVTEVSSEIVLKGFPDMRVSLQSQPGKGWAALITIATPDDTGRVVPFSMVVGHEVSIPLNLFLKTPNLADIYDWFFSKEDAKEFLATLDFDGVKELYQRWVKVVAHLQLLFPKENAQEQLNYIKKEEYLSYSKM